jgi:ankyrin repeat protein
MKKGLMFSAVLCLLISLAIGARIVQGAAADEWAGKTKEELDEAFREELFKDELGYERLRAFFASYDKEPDEGYSRDLWEKNDRDFADIKNRRQRGLLAELDEEKIRALVGHGADVNMRDAAGKTLLMRALDMPSLFVFLLENGADVNAVISADAGSLTVETAPRHTNKLVSSDGTIEYEWDPGSSSPRRILGEECALTLLLQRREIYSRPVKNLDNNLFLEKARMLISHGADVNRLFAGKTPLMIVCELAWQLNESERGVAAEMIDCLLSGGADVNVKDGQGRTAIMYSFTNCLMSDSLNEPIIRKLIESGADVNIRDSGDTPLLYFAKTVTRPKTWYASRGQGWVEKKALGIADDIKIFIDAGADVNCADGGGVTPLMAFAENGCMLDAVRVLVEAGADVRARDARGKGVIPRAFSDEVDVDLDGLIYLIDAVNDKAFLTDGDGTSMLARNVKDGYYRKQGEFVFFNFGYLPAFFVERLLKFDWTQKEKDDALSGVTVWGSAFYFGKIVPLVKNGADINAYDANGMTLLMNAPRAASNDVTRLIGMGFDVNARGPGGGTILTMDSISRQTPEFISALLDGGADVSVSDGQGRTCLNVAHTAHCVRLLIDAGANPKTVDANGRTPLHDALPSDPEALTVLISAGVDVNKRDDSGKTALLSWMERGGNPDGIRLLLDAGAGAEDFGENSPLMLAVSYGKALNTPDGYIFPYSGYGLYARDFLKRGADPNAVFPGGDTPLLTLIKQPLSLPDWFLRRHNDVSGVFRASLSALSDYGADTDARDASGMTAWDYARERGEDPRKLEWLKEAARNVKIPDAAGRTRLMTAAAYGSAGQAAQLIGEGESVGAVDGLGWTALAYAAWSNTDPEIIRLLTDNGADVNVRDSLGKTPLMHAVWHNPNPKVVRALLDAGAKIGIRDRSGVTAVHIAIAHDASPEVIGILFGAGAELTDRNHLGGQMLRALSVATGNPETVRVLIGMGVPVDDRDDDGQTALMKSVSRNRNSAVTGALIECGADINARDNGGLSVLDFALKGDVEIYRLLVNAGVDLKTESAWWTPAEKGLMQQNPDQRLWNMPKYRW